MTQGVAEPRLPAGIAHWFAVAMERAHPPADARTDDATAAAPETWTLHLPDAVSRRVQEISGGRAQETTVLALAAVAAAFARHFPGADCILEVDHAGRRVPVAPPRGVTTPRALVEALDGALFVALEAAEALTGLAAPLRARLTGDARVGLGPLSSPDADASAERPGLELRLTIEAGASRLDAACDGTRVSMAQARAIAADAAQWLTTLAQPDEPVAAPPPVPAIPRTGADPRGLLAGFLDAAEAHPNACALLAEGETVTYGALRDRAARFAARIAREAENPVGGFVAVCPPKSPDAITAILGVLFAGAAYAPLDPELPTLRLQAMIDALRPAALVISLGQLLDFSWFEGRLLVFELDGETESPSPTLDRTPEDAAYAIFTSGSSGAPKPVIVTHGAIVNYVNWKIRYYELDASAVTLQLAPLFFDSAVSDLFSTLSCGGTLALAPSPATVDPRDLAQFARACGATIFAIVPSFYGSLLDFLPPLPTLRTITVAGEKTHASLVARHFARFPEVRLVNEYGPTEGTVCATALTLYQSDAAQDPSIGAPIDHVRIYLLDGTRRVGAGETGEICIGGAGLARGYAGDSASTADRFAPDPFRPGERVYRTGDLARMRSDGLLDYRGRIDGQVKIRGHRLELGEIEAALLAHPAIREACAIARGEGADAEILVFVVSAQGAAPPDLTEHLASRLPAPMASARIIAVDALPLTRNGKVDRTALPVPEESSVGVGQFDATEALVASIWETILGRAPERPDDDFFDLGGHSLKAIQLLSRLISAFSVEVTLRDVFDNPTVATQARLLCGGERSVGRAPAPIERIGDAEDFALTPAQRGLWLAEALGQAPAAHHIPERLIIDGAFDLSAFADALSDLARRHDIFRMSFHDIAGEPRFRIAETPSLAFGFHDLTNAEDEAARLAASVDEAEGRPFDLGRAPLARVVVIRARSGRHLIFLTLHHLITDGWSMGVILRDLAELYASRLDAREPRLPDTPIRYRDYAAWKNALADGVEGERARAYWRTTLAGLRLEPLISDATASPEAGREQSALREFPLPHALSERLLRLARDCGVRTFPLLLTLLAGALHRLAGRRNLLIGAVTSDRVRPELEHLAGLLVSTLPLHIQLAQDIGFADLVRRVDRGVREGMEHQAAGLGTLLADLRAGAREEGADTFEIVATYEAADGQMAFGAFRLAGRAERDTVPAPRLPAKFALAVLFVEDRGRLALTFHRDAAQVSSEMVARLETEFCAVAAQAVDAPQASLALPPTLAVGRIRPPDSRRLVERFEWVAREQPDAPAIEDGRRITYGELDRWANGVARALHDRVGVGPEAICAILGDRSASMIVAALGVLKAGGAYLPVAPDVPNPRIETMLTQARCACLLVVDDATADRAADFQNMVLMDIRGVEPCETPPRGGAPHPNRLCYVIFTSGSTGAPKGVAVEEASVVNLCDWWAESFELTPSSRVAVCSSVGFDAFTLETWPTLLRGGTLFIYRDDEREPGRLSRNFARDGVTRAFLATPLFDLLRETQAARLGPDIRFATGGDALVLSKPLELPVINLYGPTEATVTVTSEALRAGHAPGPASLGRPIDNARIYILGPDLLPLPAGAIGQIAIGGLPLARGYIGRPRETAEAFAPDPTKPGARMFLTGDLGRITGSDSIEFLGRCDEQVKIRGHRVEPGDIEAALRSHPHVGQAAVVVAGRNGARFLSAFVTPAAGQQPNPADVLDFLRSRLPEFMLPRNIQFLDALPLTGNGKIDRRALSALAPVEASAAPVGRRREIDELIAALWAQALGAPELGAADDFFALGGDSLAAMRLTAAVSAALGASLDLRLLFDHPSLRDYCAAAEACARRAASPVLRPPFRAIADAKSYPLTRTQETLYRQAVAAPRAPLFEIRLFLLIAGSCPIARLQQAIETLAARHGVLRSAYRLDAAGVPAAHIVTAGRPIETHDLSHLEEEERLAAITTHLNALIAAPLPIDEYPPHSLAAARPGARTGDRSVKGASSRARRLVGRESHRRPSIPAQRHAVASAAVRFRGFRELAEDLPRAGRRQRPARLLAPAPRAIADVVARESRGGGSLGPAGDCDVDMAGAPRRRSWPRRTTVAMHALRAPRRGTCKGDRRCFRLQRRGDRRRCRKQAGRLRGSNRPVLEHGPAAARWERGQPPSGAACADASDRDRRTAQRRPSLRDRPR